MPLPGGAADKVGNRYEKQWGIEALLGLLSGKHHSVTIEKPGETWAEFKTESGGLSTWYQVKLKGTTASGTLNSISSILMDFKAKLSDGDRCVLIPGTGNDALDVLTTRARESSDFAKFNDKFIDAKGRKSDFESLTKTWKVSPEEAYDWLKRVEVWTRDEIRTKEHNELLARQWLVGEPATVVSVLGTIYEEQIHQTIDPQKLLELLAIHDIRPVQIVGETPKAEWQIEALKQTQDILTKLKNIGKYAKYPVTMNTDTSDWESLALAVPYPAGDYADSIAAAHSLVDCLEDGIPKECLAQVSATIEQVGNLQKEIDSWVTQINDRWGTAKELACEYKYEVDHTSPPVDVDDAYWVSRQYKSMRSVAAERDALITQQDLVMAVDNELDRLKSLIAAR